MGKLGRRHVTLVVFVAAVAAEGCGGSSSSKSQPANIPAPSSPATSSTPAASSTPGTSTSATGGVTASTSISSPAFRALLIKQISTSVNGKLSQSQLNGIADCAIKKFQGIGVKTVGDASKHGTEARQFGAQCAKELNIHVTP